MARIRWVFFDLGSTLVDERGAEDLYLRDVFTLLHAFGSEVEWQDYLRRVRMLIGRREAAGHRGLASKLFEIFSTQSRRPEFLTKLDDAWTVERYTSLWRLFRDVEPVLSKLGERYNCGIIANQDSAVKGTIQEKFRIAGLFKHICLSGDVGYAKPDERLFLKALAKSSASPDESVYVGDRVDFDIAPANRLGMVTVRVRRDSLFSRIEPIHAAEKSRFELNDLHALPRILSQL